MFPLIKISNIQAKQNNRHREQSKSPLIKYEVQPKSLIE